MDKFNRGDRVIVYRKTRPWEGGKDETKDSLLVNTTVLIVEHQDADQVVCFDPILGYGVVTIHTNCLRKLTKKIIFI